MSQEKSLVRAENIKVRTMRLGDFDDLVAVWKKCFPSNMGVWEKKHIRSQLKMFPEGQIVIELDGKLVASSSSVLVDFDEYGDSS